MTLDGNHSEPSVAIAQPTCVIFEDQQSGSWTVTLDPPEDITGWDISVKVRAYNGGTALITKTTASVAEIQVTDAGQGVFVVYFSAADLTLTHGPGAYVIQAHRTNALSPYPITDPSPLILRPADATAYPTLTNLGEYSAHALDGIELDDDMAAQLIQLMFSAEEQIKRYCGRDFVYRSAQTEYYDGTGTDKLLLARWPFLPANVAVSVDIGGYYGQASGSFAASTALTLGTDFIVPITPTWGDGQNHSGIIKRIGTTWPLRASRPHGNLSYRPEPLPGCIKVTYTAGYSLIPHPVKEAVWNLTSMKAQTSTYGRLAQSESGEGYSVSYGDMDDGGSLPPTIRNLLASYRRLLI